MKVAAGREGWSALALVLAVGCLGAGWPSAVRAELVAEQITAANARDRLFGGSDPDGGIGDWYLSNGIVELIVDEAALQDDLPPGVDPPPKQSENALTGGTLVDLGLVGADNDQLNQLFTVGGLSFDNIVSNQSIAASVDAASARLVVTGVLPGFIVNPVLLPVTTEYILFPGDSFVTIKTSVTNKSNRNVGGLGGFFDVLPWTTRAVVPFSPLRNKGFRHSALDPTNPLASLELPPYAVGPGIAGPDDGVMDPQTGKPSGEVSYGILGVETLRDADADGPLPPQALPANLLFGISGVEVTAFGALPGGRLDVGASLSYERRLYVGGRNDVASAANPILTALAARQGFALGTLSGDIDAADTGAVAASVVVTRTGGPAVPSLPNNAPVTHFRTAADGGFAGVVVPAGIYELEVRSAERDTVVVSDIAVVAGADTRVSVPPLSAVARLSLRVSAPAPGRRRASKRASSSSRLLPAKVTILGRNGTPDPRFGYDREAINVSPGQPDVDLRPETFGGALAQANFVYLPNGEGSVELRPGEYEVFASRGPEYSLDRALVTVAAGDTTALDFVLRRLVATFHALAADFHIHSARSLDSSAAPRGRVAASAGEGLEVMVSADHDFVLDYATVIADLGLWRYVHSIAGTEATSNVPNPPAFPNAAGHVNGWPIRLDPDARKDGAIEDEFVAPNMLFSRLRRAGAEVIQYNHLRAGVRGLGSIGFFNNIGCNRCANDIDQMCSVDADCPAAPAPQDCTCVGYQPDRPLTAPPNDLLLDDDVTGTSGVGNPDGYRNIDFDVMEVANGLNIDGFLLLRDDWFSLLDQAYGETPNGPVPFIPATGVSDSHRNTLESAGYFRTYVLGLSDQPQALNTRRFDQRVRRGRMLATSGPYIRVLARGSGRVGGIGDTLVAKHGHVDLFIRVTATNWIPVDEVRVIANGVVVPELVFDAGTEPPVRPAPAVPWSSDASGVQRFVHLASLELDRDTWIVVEAGESLDSPLGPDPFASQIVPGIVPFAFTNPIFVDVGGDGYAPPGIGGAGSGPTASDATAAHRGGRHLRSRRLLHRHRLAPGAGHTHLRLQDIEFPAEAVAKGPRR